jgi:hypothetical protein
VEQQLRHDGSPRVGVRDATTTHQRKQRLSLYLSADGHIVIHCIDDAGDENGSRGVDRMIGPNGAGNEGLSGWRGGLNFGLLVPTKQASVLYR